MAHTLNSGNSGKTEFEGCVVNTQVEKISSVIFVVFFVLVIFWSKTNEFAIIFFFLWAFFGQKVFTYFFNKKASVKIENKAILINSETEQKRFAFSPELKVATVYQSGKYRSYPTSKASITNQETEIVIDFKKVKSLTEFLVAYNLASGSIPADDKVRSVLAGGFSEFITKSFGPGLRKLQIQKVEMEKKMQISSANSDSGVKKDAPSDSFKLKTAKFATPPENLPNSSSAYNQSGHIIQDDRGKQIVKIIILLVIVVSAYYIFINLK